MQLLPAQIALRNYADESSRVTALRFFKTGPSQYGEGDEFIGVRVPCTRQIARQYQDLSLQDITHLLESRVHEDRLLALIIMCLQYQKSTPTGKDMLTKFYVSQLSRVNNWDLVDTSAYHILGESLSINEAPYAILTNLAKSHNVWERRVSIIATFALLKRKRPEETLRIAQILLHDPHDLIQKAVGWMLREMGKRCNEDILTSFLTIHASHMPRTMLRYAIEKLSAKNRAYFLALRSQSLEIGMRKK